MYLEKGETDFLIKRILVVDDEPFQRKGLKNMILSKRPGTQVETARNGCLALEMIRKNPPDLVMTDIRMPNMDGLELAKQICDNFSAVHVVLVSAYQEFTYAKQAMRFGVRDYLLKPYRPQDIEAVLGRLDRSGSSEACPPEQERHRRNLSRLLAGTMRTEEREEFLHKWGKELPLKGCIASCGFCLSSAEKSFRSSEADRLISEIGSWFLREEKECFIDGGSVSSQGLYLIMPGLSEQDSLALMLRLQNFLLSRFGLGSGIGVSDCSPDLLRNAHEVAQQASEACSYRFFKPAGSLTLYRDVAGALSKPLPPMSDLEQRLTAAVGSGDLDGIHQAFRQMRELLTAKPYFHPGIVKHRLLTGTFAVLHQYESQMYASEVGSLQNRAYTEFFNARSLDLLVSSCDGILCAVANRSGPDDGRDHDLVVRQCLKWIGENIGREISLAEAAEHFHFSGSYFSSLIKRRTGMSYGQYILSLRMQEARGLLQRTDEKVQTIALRVGYRDPCYFNRVFKRENGATPDQYRRRSVG